MRTATGNNAEKPRLVKSCDIVELIMGTVAQNCHVYVNDKELRGVRSVTISASSRQATHLVIDVFYPYPPVEDGHLNVHKFRGIFIDESDWPKFHKWLEFLKESTNEG